MTAPPNPVPIEALLGHRAWVHRLARALARDSASADDLEQEAWVRAQTKPPRHGGALKAWLGTVLRRKASDMRRSESRRTKREEAAARPERQRSTLDLVSEAETLKRVVAVLLELEEPYRTALLLRYFDDLTPPQVAARTGVPLETARTRLKRGLERLRERFDRESDGRRATWTLALQPLSERAAPEPHLPVGGVSVAGTTLGALLVTLKTKIGLAVAALALLAVGVGVATRPSPDDVSREAAPATPPPEVASAPGLQPALSRVETSADGEEAPSRPTDAGGGTSPPPLIASTCGIRVEVLDEHGMRVRGGTVTLTVDGVGNLDVALVERMAANPERFTWLTETLDLAMGNPAEVKAIPAEFAGLHLQAKADVAPYAPVAMFLESALEVGRVASVRMSMRPGRRVQFLVTDAADGRPIANARILSTTELMRRGIDYDGLTAPDGPGWATTGADGRATVTELGGGAHDVEILADGYRPGRIDRGSFEGGTTPVRLDVSHDDAVLEVVVHDPSGAPVVGQRVQLNTRLRLTPITLATDASGVARFERLPSGLQILRLESLSWVLRVRDAHWPGEPRPTIFAYVDDLPAGTTRRISLGYVVNGGGITCEVVGSKGLPVPGVEVHLIGTAQRQGTTDALGHVEFPNLAAGRCRMILIPRDSSRWLTPERDVQDGEELHLRHVLGERSISGVVRAASEGRPPIAGAGIYAESTLGGGATSGPDGSYVIRGAAPGHYRVEANLNGFANGWVTVDVPNDVDVVAPEIVLFRGGRILLRAAPAGREVLAAARLRLVDAQGREVGLGQDISGGEDFRRSDRVTPGRYTLEITRIGRAAAERIIDVEDGKDTVVVLSAP